MKKENDLKTDVAHGAREKGSNSNLWSDGEQAIVDELCRRSYYSRYCVQTGEQILFRQNMPIPRVGDIVKIKLLEASEELEFVKKLFNCDVVITYDFSQAFAFMVKAVECLVSNVDEYEPDYTVIIEPLLKHKEFKTVFLEVK